MKRCTKCGQEKPREQFSMNKGYLRPHCKACAAAASRDYNRKNPGRCGRTLKEWKAKNPEAYKARLQSPSKIAYARAHVARHSATSRVHRHVKAGKLQRLPCLICGDENVVAHHSSYAKDMWLAVTWLCRSHHKLLHLEFAAFLEEMVA